MVGISRAANLTNDAGTCYRFQVRCHLVEKIAGSLAWVSEQPPGRHSSIFGFASIRPPPTHTHSRTPTWATAGSMRLGSSVTGQLGTIEGLDTACPSVILDCGSGRILLRGVVVPTKGRLLNLQAKTTGTDPRDLIVTDQFEYLIVLSECVPGLCTFSWQHDMGIDSAHAIRFRWNLTSACPQPILLSPPCTLVKSLSAAPNRYTWVGTAEANPELNPLPFPDGVLEADDQTIDVQEESDTEQSQTTSQSQSQSRRQSASQSLENGMSPTLEEREEEEASWQEQESNHEGKKEEEEALQALRRPRRSTARAKKYTEVESDEELVLLEGEEEEEEKEEEEEEWEGEEQDQQQAKEEEEFAPPKSKALALAGKTPSSSARKTPARKPKPNSKQLAPVSSDEEVVVLGDSSSQAEEMEDEGRERLAATASSRPRRASAAGPKKYKVELSSEEEEEEEDSNHEEQKGTPTIVARNLQQTMATSATKRPRRETKPKNYKEDNSGGSASSEGDDIPFAQKAHTKKKNATSSPHPAAKPVKFPAAAKPVAAAKSTSSTWSPVAPKGRSAKIQGKGDSASILDAFG